MRIPLTKYGLPQVVVFPAIVLALMVVFPLAGKVFLPLWAIVLIEALLALICLWILTFFRDPYRPLPSDKNLLLAPADGRVTDIEIVDEDNFIGQAAMRIGIFMSIFNTHINRAPCSSKVETIIYRKGKYKNALNPQSGKVNESNNLGLVRTDSPQQRLFVRQISGAIARRIVCDTSEGQVLTGGEKFGMIKFGSRTELYVPAREDVKCLVQIGDKVKAGLTPLIRYEKLTAENAESAEQGKIKAKQQPQVL
jgi:phosphatidylserine decarboxylase